MLPLDLHPENLCIMRLSALGDAIHTVPVVRVLRKHWPQTRITWIIGKPEHRLLAELEDVDFIVFNKRGGWPAVRALRKTLRERHFDLLLHMQVSARANLLSLLVQAPIRLGWDKGRSRDFHSWFTRYRVAQVPLQHQVDGFLEFPRALGIPVEQPVWDLPIANEAKTWVREQIPAERPILLIHPCSSHERRNWRAEYYAQVADHAAIERGMQVVLSGGPNDLEHKMGTAIESAMNATCINLIGKDTLEQSKALLQRADLVISPDTGPVHVASAFGTPVIGLYAATWSKRSGPYNSLPLCVDRYEEAARRFRKREASDLRWGHRIEELGVMDLIRPQDVIERIEHWYSSGAQDFSSPE